MIESKPTPFLTWANTVGPGPRILAESLAITSKLAPTISAKSVYFVHE